MKTNLFAFSLFLTAMSSFGQISYEKGYFIDNDNRNTQCLIKNNDWGKTPNEFTFKRDNSAIPEKGTLNKVKEFGIYHFSKFIRATINIDRSSDDVQMLTHDKNPVWSKEQLFLKVLVEGKVSLYYYEEGNLKRFFYSVTDTSINQLVYKKYFVDNDNNIGYNYKYRQQLWNDVKCANTDMSDVKGIKYSFTDLELYFKNYLKCTGDSTVNYNTKSKRDFFNLKITPGINFSSMSLSNSLSEDNFTFKNTVNLRLGIETEFILPFNKNKWGILFEPTFQYFNSEKVLADKTATIKYSSLGFPIGIRYYFFLNENVKAFCNGIYIPYLAVDFNSKFVVGEIIMSDISLKNSYAIGGGLAYKRISAEIRYYTNKQLLRDYVFWSTNYHTTSFIIGYNLLKTRQKTNTHK